MRRSTEYVYSHNFIIAIYVRLLSHFQLVVCFDAVPLMRAVPAAVNSVISARLSLCSRCIGGRFVKLMIG